MKCQIVTLTGSSCRATAEGLIVPEGRTAQEIYTERLWLCPKHGRQVLKQSEGGRWVTLAQVETDLVDHGAVLAAEEASG